MRDIARIIFIRLALSLITLALVSLIVFWAVEWIPGDPATRILGQAASPERAQILREKMHLDDPPVLRYQRWLVNIIHGNWGISIITGNDVISYIRPFLKNTLILSSLTLAVFIPLSLVLGIFTAIFRSRFISNFFTVLILIGSAIPEFVIGILFLLTFALKIPIFPPLALMDQVHSVKDLFYTLTLPVLTLTAAMTAHAVRMMQGSLISVLESDYVLSGELRGLPKLRIIIRHALPNAMGPALRVIALETAWLMGGVVLVEAVFTFPGLGHLLIQSIHVLDTPVVEAIAVILASVYILANLIADLTVNLLNPKLRLG